MSDACSNAFEVGDHVEVRDNGDKKWEPGTVAEITERGHIKVKLDGWDSAHRWDECRLRCAVSFATF